MSEETPQTIIRPRGIINAVVASLISAVVITGVPSAYQWWVNKDYQEWVDETSTPGWRKSAEPLKIKTHTALRYTVVNQGPEALAHPTFFWIKLREPYPRDEVWFETTGSARQMERPDDGRSDTTIMEFFEGTEGCRSMAVHRSYDVYVIRDTTKVANDPVSSVGLHTPNGQAGELLSSMATPGGPPGSWLLVGIVTGVISGLLLYLVAARWRKVGPKGMMLAQMAHDEDAVLASHQTETVSPKAADHLISLLEEAARHRKELATPSRDDLSSEQ